MTTLLRAEKIAQQIARARRRQALQRRHRQRHITEATRTIHYGQCIQQLRGIGLVPGCAGKRFAVFGRARFKSRHDLVPQKIAQIIRVAITFVFDPRTNRAPAA
jgi:hypothetical protein